MRRRAIVSVACGLALAVTAASAHSGVPKAWWLEEGAAVTSLCEALKPRYRASATGIEPVTSGLQSRAASHDEQERTPSNARNHAGLRCE